MMSELWISGGVCEDVVKMIRVGEIQWLVRLPYYMARSSSEAPTYRPIDYMPVCPCLVS